MLEAHKDHMNRLLRVDALVMRALSERDAAPLSTDLSRQS